METYDVYVANLLLDHTEAQVRGIFDIVGDIQGVKLLPPKDGMNGRVGFVRFYKEKDAEYAARYLNNQVLENDRLLKVRYRKKDNDESSGGTATNGQINGNSNSEKQGSFSNVPEEKTNEVALIVHIESPIKFWSQEVSAEIVSKLEEVTSNLQNHCPTQAKPIGQLSTQQLYGCQFSEDGLWYRCVIEKYLPKDVPQVRYIDFGNVEIVQRSSLVTLPPSLNSIPPLATCCQLDNIELVDCAENTTSYTDCMNKISKLLADETVELKMNRKVKDVNFVEVLRVHNGQSLNLIDELLATGVAKVTNKTCSKGLSQAPSSLSEKSPFRKSILRSNGMDLVRKHLHKELSESTEEQTLDVDLKGKLLKESEKHQQLKSAVHEKERRISDLEKKLEQFELKKRKEFSEMEAQLCQSNTEKENLLKSVISTKFKTLVENVKTLRLYRANLSDISDVFPPTLQSIIDLYTNSDDVISLSTIQQYESIQIEQDSLKVQMGLIEQCHDKNELNELIEERDHIVRKCVKYIRSFLKHTLTLPLEERERRLTESLEYIRNNYPQMTILENSQHELQTNFLEKAVVACKDENILKMRHIHGYRQVSNHLSSKLFKLIGELQRECHCVISIQPVTHLDDDDVDEIMQRYQDAVLLEIKDTKKIGEELKRSGFLIDVVNHLASLINMELRDIQLLRDTEQKKGYEKQLETFKRILENKPDATIIFDVRKQIKLLKSKYRHKYADITDLEEDSGDTNELELLKLDNELEEIRLQLHKQFLLEMKEMRHLAERSRGEFPELRKIHPELLLAEFMESGCLYQRNRTIEQYPQNMIVMATQLNQTTFRSSFNGQNCVVKELSISGQTFDEILALIVKYTKEKNEHWANLECVFTNKTMRKFYIHQEYASEGNIMQFVKNANPNAQIIKTLIHDILKSLDNPIPHGDIKLENVLVDKTKDGKLRAYLAEPNLINDKETVFRGCLNRRDYVAMCSFEETISHEADMACVGAILFWAIHQPVFTDNLGNDIQTIAKDPHLKQLLQRMLNSKPSDRISWKEALEHPYFQREDHDELNKLEKTSISEKSIAVVDDLIDLEEEPSGTVNSIPNEIESELVNTAVVIDEKEEIIKEEEFSKMVSKDKMFSGKTIDIESELDNTPDREEMRDMEEEDSALLSKPEIVISTPNDVEVELVEGSEKHEGEGDAGIEIDGWMRALSRKKVTKNILQEKPEEAQISDDDQF